ncbi:glycosyltransferase family 2 protein [Fictibacillus sp. b24]|uniref:glycosyltransferase family 2 protein n=1 Tax=Fictibacillus sp. b24 TaxID=3055863 RepID=UPI0025A00F44|nr:glycosyltransferase family 2 protein [Fictibacillus sp. b24]MDM5316746.1 glycosyltransferase family 2 protein [Fictibacillus sp. b24]
MNKPDVSVLIPSYNPGQFLRKAIESVFYQSYKEWQIVLVDDHSTDNSLSTIDEYLKDSRVTLLKNNTNLGQSKTQNRGLSLIQTPYILKLDADDWLFPNTMEKMRKEMDLVSEKVALIWGNKTDIYEDQDGNILFEVPRIGGRSYNNPYEFMLSNDVPFPRFYRTSAVKSVGGWPTDDPWDGRHMEDRRIDYLLIEQFEIHWMNEMLYNYRQHPNNATKKIALYNEVFEWLVHYTLKKWGDQYEPIFKTYCGWRQLAQLKPKKKGCDL